MCERGIEWMYVCSEKEIYFYFEKDIEAGNCSGWIWNEMRQIQGVHSWLDRGIKVHAVPGPLLSHLHCNLFLSSNST
jgi:hypothetical protein